MVNLILNKNFNGAQVNLEDGDRWQGGHAERKLTVTLGHGFDDNRAHIEVAGSPAAGRQPRRYHGLRAGGPVR